MIAEARIERRDNLDVLESNTVLEREKTTDLYVMKFGGFSMGDAVSIEQTANIVASYKKNNGVTVVVVSAMKGTTDKLDEITKGNLIEDRLLDIDSSHREVIEKLHLSSKRREELLNNYIGIYNDLRFSARNIFPSTDANKARIFSYGEQFSALLLEARCQELRIEAVALNTDHIIETDSNFLSANPDLEKTQENARRLVSTHIQKGKVPIITGFFGGTKDGMVTILGRNCSDYSAAIMAYVLGAKELILWKNTNGLYDEKGGTIEEMTYGDYLNSPDSGIRKAVQENVVLLLQDTDIIVWVKHVYDPDGPGTKMARFLDDSKK
ncbi:MAG: hypothetical protein M1268_00820 [Patescibacteria group bacterium]|nr:hypothetical protein [Patescibacteria group bacterium]